MADAKYNSFKGDIQKGLIDLTTSTINCMLVTSAYIPNIDTHTNKTDITNEVTGTAYVAGGKALTTKTVTVDTGTDLAKFDADDVVWSASTITARGAVLYKDTTGELIAYFDFVTDKTSSAGDFTVQWDAAGILTIA